MRVLLSTLQLSGLFSAVLQAQMRVTGRQYLTFGALFPGTPELPRSPATGRRAPPLGQGDEFVHQGGVSHLLLGLEGSGPESGPVDATGSPVATKALLSATDCACTVAPPRNLAFCKHVPTYKLSNLLSYIYLQHFTIVARFWQPTSQRRDGPFKQQNGNHDPPDKSTPGVIRGRKTRGLDLVEIARCRRWKQDGA